jgi:hypothetical protein
MSKIIRKPIKEKERDKELLDDLLTQLQAESDNPVEEEEVVPIEITEQVRERMIKLMESYLLKKEKITKINAIKKDIVTKMDSDTRDLMTMMKLYGLNELIKGSNRFVLDQTTKKKALKKDEFKEVITTVLNDPDKVNEIYTTANDYAEEVVIEKLKCLKYKGS